MDSVVAVLSDYAPVASPIIALMISVIALWNSDVQPNKQWLRVGAIVAAVVGTIATIGTQYHTLQVDQHERQAAEQRLTILSQLIAEGDRLQAPLGDPNSPVNKAKIDAWVTKTEDFLAHEPGGGFVSRFRDVNGMVVPNQPLRLYPEGLTGPPTQAYAFLAYRLARLQQFSRELSARLRW
jgi:hypothetical protein